MKNEDEARLARPDGSRYDAAPHAEESRVGRVLAYGALGVLVLVMVLLIATGTVEIFPG